MPCVKSGARAGSLYRNLVAHALTLGASGDRAPVRQQPWGEIWQVFLTYGLPVVYRSFTLIFTATLSQKKILVCAYEITGLT